MRWRSGDAIQALARSATISDLSVQHSVRRKFVYRRTFTDGDVALFCGVTGDFNPYHQDEVFAASTPSGFTIGIRYVRVPSTRRRTPGFVAYCSSR